MESKEFIFIKEFINEQNKEELKILVFDENDDGMLDNIVSFERDGAGRISKVVLDFEYDDIPDVTIYFEYDAQDRLKKKIIDKNMDGKANAVVEYDWDEQGNPIIRYDDNADGRIDFVERKDESETTHIDDVRPNTQKFTDFLGGFIRNS